MAKYEEMRRLTPEKLQTLCNNKNWYTRGTSDQFSRLMDKVWQIEESDQGITADQLGEIAEDILQHSDTEYTVESIMWELNRAANTSFFRV